MDSSDEDVTETWEDDSETDLPDQTENDVPYVQRRLIKWYSVALLTFQFLFSLSDTAFQFLFSFLVNFLTPQKSPSVSTIANLKFPTTLSKVQQVSNTTQKGVCCMSKM